jgi:hypothetical protein
MNFSVYPVSTSESFVVETDVVSSTAPLLVAGTIQQQVGAPFLAAPGSTFTGTSVAALTGRAPVGSTYVPDVALVSIIGTGTSSFTITDTENQEGIVSQHAPLSANFQQADQYGRLATDVISPIGPVFYMISQSTAFCVGEEQSQTSQPHPFFGVFQPQSTGPFGASTIAGTFVQGTGAPAEAPVQDVAGTVEFVNTVTTSGDVGGVQDQSTSTANTAGQTVAGGYVVLSSTTGFGSIAFTDPDTTTGEFLIVSPSEIFMITTTTGDANPAIIEFEQ